MVGMVIFVGKESMEAVWEVPCEYASEKKVLVLKDFPPGGCSMGGMVLVKMLQQGAPFTVVETCETSVGAMGILRVYGRLEDPVCGWVDLTFFQCEKYKGPVMVLTCSFSWSDAATSITGE
ncbi:unnamed protein product, partial [Polarella glacialis]